MATTVAQHLNTTAHFTQVKVNVRLCGSIPRTEMDSLCLKRQLPETTTMTATPSADRVTTLPTEIANDQDSVAQQLCSQLSTFQQQQQQQQMSMPYNMPPGAYFAGGAMGMPPRGPAYPPQFVAGPPMPGRPGVAPYGVFPMPPGGVPPNMQMRGPNGAPYYPGPNGPMPYPPGAYMGHGMMDDGGDPNYRGRGGRGPGGGRGNRRPGGRSRGGGRGGRGSYNSHHQNAGGSNSGRSTPQQQPMPPAQQSQEGAPTSKPLEGAETGSAANSAEGGE
mmetsp:Transcript_11702/g.21592  ORF Transcript_11702/g.21592 Transcript_11702/m.21592 type:complete len:276 (-) Transcript_11702:1204-2031(-)